MVKRKDVLNSLSRSRLLEIAQDFEIEGLSRLKKADIVARLSRSRAMGLEDLLGELSRDELKSACRAAGLDDGGREKAKIIDRLMGKEEVAKRPPPNPRKMSAKKGKESGMAPKKTGKERPIESYEHRDKERSNNPPVGLVSDPEEAVHLELEELGEEAFLPAPSSLAESVLRLLAESTAPLSGVEIRRRLRVNNRRLGRTLRDLDRRGEIERNGNGWGIPPVESMEGRRLLFG